VFPAPSPANEIAMSILRDDDSRSTQIPTGLTRRDALAEMLRFAAFAHPVGRLVLRDQRLAFNTSGVELQPLLADVRRLMEAMAWLGEPFSDAERASISAAANSNDETRAVVEIQRILDPRCLLSIRINPESRVSSARGAAPPRLVEHGWRAFLMKVRNEAGATGQL